MRDPQYPEDKPITRRQSVSITAAAILFLPACYAAAVLLGAVSLPAIVFLALYLGLCFWVSFEFYPGWLRNRLLRYRRDLLEPEPRTLFTVWAFRAYALFFLGAVGFCGYHGLRALKHPDLYPWYYFLAPAAPFAIAYLVVSFFELRGTNPPWQVKHESGLSGFPDGEPSDLLETE